MSLCLCIWKVKSDKHKHSTTTTSGKTGQPQNSGTQGGGKVGLKDTLASGDTGLKESTVCLTNEQLQRILSTVQTTSNGQDPPEDHRTQGSGSDSDDGINIE